MKTFARIANIGGFVLTLLLAVPAVIRCWAYMNMFNFAAGCLLALLALFPHEPLHAVCFKQNVYLYTNWEQGLLFVVGPEPMSKLRFIWVCLLPNLLLGCPPYIIGLLFPQLVFLAPFGTICIGCGFGNYYNVFNALTQMTRGAKTYLYQMRSFWYLPLISAYQFKTPPPDGTFDFYSPRRTKSITCGRTTSSAACLAFGGHKRFRQGGFLYIRMNEDMYFICAVKTASQKSLRNHKRIKRVQTQNINTVTYLFLPEKKQCGTKHYTAPDVSSWFGQLKKKDVQEIKLFCPLAVQNRPFLGFSNTTESAILRFKKTER